MELKPVIASYSGESYRRMRQCLDARILEVVAHMAEAPRAAGDIPADILQVLVEMHVLAEKDRRIRLDTAVFLERDMQRVNETVTPLAQELARRLCLRPRGSYSRLDRRRVRPA